MNGISWSNINFKLIDTSTLTIHLSQIKELIAQCNKHIDGVVAELNSRQKKANNKKKKANNKKS